MQKFSLSKLKEPALSSILKALKFWKKYSPTSGFRKASCFCLLPLLLPVMHGDHFPSLISWKKKIQVINALWRTTKWCSLMHYTIAYANIPNFLQEEVYLASPILCIRPKGIRGCAELSPSKWQTWKMGHQHPSLGDFVGKLEMALRPSDSMILSWSFSTS